MQALSSLDLLAIVLVAVSSMAIGFVWYSLGVFGKMWMKENGLKESDLKSGPGIGYLLTTVGAVVMAVAMSLVMNYAQIDKMVGGLKLALLLWVGFVATSYAATYIFSQKSFKLFLIDSGYFLASFLAAGAIIAYFN